MSRFNSYNLKKNKRIYKNPFFKNNKNTFKSVLLLTIPIILIGGGIWLIFDSPITRIRDIEVIGGITEDDDEIREIIFNEINGNIGILPSHSILRRYKSIVSDIMVGEFDNLELANFNIESRVIKLEVLENAYGILTRVNGNWEFISRNYNVNLDELEIVEVENRINHHEINDYFFHPKTPILELENQNQMLNSNFNDLLFDNLIELNSLLIDYSFKPSLFRIENNNDTWVKVIGLTDVPVYVELLSDMEMQLKTLEIYLRQNNIHESHIDIRFAPRVYIK